MAPAPLSTGCQSLPPLPTIKWAPLVLVPEWVGLCILEAPVGLSNDLSCEAGSLSCCCSPTPTGFFNQRSEALFPHAGALGHVVCFAPRRLSRFICARVWGLRAATRHTACPVLRHSESGPLGLCVRQCGPQGLLVGL